MRGEHHVKSWSVTQKRVTLSSAEAEVGALVKTSTEVLGILQMAEGLGRTVTAEILVDSSAAMRIVHRKGCGKLRHIRVGQLWVQEVAENEELRFQKVKGEQNPAYKIPNILQKFGWTYYWASSTYTIARDVQKKALKYEDQHRKPQQ